MPRDDRLIVRFQSEHYDPADRDRLWKELLDHAIEDLGADSFSAQMDLPPGNPAPEPNQARDSLLTHIRLVRPKRSFLGLRAPRWPLEPVTKEWIRRGGPSVYRVTLWKGNAWILESAFWGKYFNLVVHSEGWARLRTDRTWLADLDPPPTSGAFRKEDERVRRGWTLSRPMRILAALAVALGAGALSLLYEESAWIAGGALAGIFAYLSLPGREPGPMHRLIAEARMPTDPAFNRRFERALGWGVIGSLVAAVAIAVAFVTLGDSPWRLALWGLALAGGLLALYSAAITTWWTFKYRRRQPP